VSFISEYWNLTWVSTHSSSFLCNLSLFCLLVLFVLDHITTPQALSPLSLSLSLSLCWIHGDWGMWKLTLLVYLYYCFGSIYSLALFDWKFGIEVVGCLSIDGWWARKTDGFRWIEHEKIQAFCVFWIAVEVWSNTQFRFFIKVRIVTLVVKKDLSFLLVCMIGDKIGPILTWNLLWESLVLS